MASQLEILNEIARKLRKLDCICANTASNFSSLVEDYQATDCNGDPVGSPLNVQPVITINKQDVSICNTTALAEAIRGLYNVPVVESVVANWNASDNNDISKIHSITFTVIGDPTDTVDLTINGGTAATLPVGNNIYSATASTVFNVDFTLDNFVGGPTVVVSIVKSA